MEIKINMNKKVNIKSPLSGSFANVCTEFKIPDRTKKVPDILNVKVVIDKNVVDAESKPLLIYKSKSDNKEANKS